MKKERRERERGDRHIERYNGAAEEELERRGIKAIGLEPIEGIVEETERDCFRVEDRGVEIGVHGDGSLREQRALTEDDKEHFRELLLRGTSLGKIGEYLGISESEVRRYLPRIYESLSYMSAKDRAKGLRDLQILRCEMILNIALRNIAETRSAEEIAEIVQGIDNENVAKAALNKLSHSLNNGTNWSYVALNAINLQSRIAGTDADHFNDMGDSLRVAGVSRSEVVESVTLKVKRILEHEGAIDVEGADSGSSSEEKE